MNWKECKLRNIVQNKVPDLLKINSLRIQAHRRRVAVNDLSENNTEARILLLYDECRLLLEATALSTGFSVLNHECYESFLAEILGNPRMAEQFRILRIVRNDIEYDGKSVELSEAKEFEKRLMQLSNSIKSL